MVELTQEQLDALVFYKQAEEEKQKFTAFKAEMDAIDKELYGVALVPFIQQLKDEREALGDTATREQLEEVNNAHANRIAPIFAEYEQKFNACRLKWGYN